MKFEWLGGPTFLLDIGKFRILGDPVLGEGENAFSLRSDTSPEEKVSVRRLVALPNIAGGRIDCVVVGRNRSDHLDETAVAKLDKSLDIVVPADGPSVDGFQKETLDWWEERVLERDGQKLAIVAVPTESRQAPRANGYLFQLDDGDVTSQVYWTGDTAWFTGAREIKARTGSVNLLVLNMGAVGKAGGQGLESLDAKAAMQFVYMFTPKKVIPICHNTFSHYEEPVDNLKAQINLTMYDKRLIILKEGETFEKA